MRNAKRGFSETENTPYAGFDTTVRPPILSRGGTSTMRSGVRPVNLAARTAGNAKNAMRTGHGANVAVIMQRMSAAVNARIVGVLSQNTSLLERDEARVELGLLSRLHRTLAAHVNAGHEDVVLCDSVVEFAENIPAILVDLEAGGARRLRRLFEFNRELLTQLSAVSGLGNAGAPLKVSITQIRPKIEQGRAHLRGSATDPAQLKPAAQQAVAVYAQLCDELERYCPNSNAALLDELTRPATT